MEEMATLGDRIGLAEIDGRPVLAALVNNMVAPLGAPVLGDPDVTPLTRAERLGFEVHRQTLVFLLAKCAAELYPRWQFRVRNSLGAALWCTLTPPDGVQGVSYAEIVERMLPRLRDLVRENLPIRMEQMPYKETVEMFGRQGRVDEINLLKHRNPPTIVVSKCGDFCAVSQTVLAPSTGVVDLFDLLAKEDGIVLNVPSTAKPDEVEPLAACSEPYFRVFRGQSLRTAVTGVETVGDLNQAILERRFDVLVRTVEALHRKELAGIADQIAARSPEVRLVLLAGPSSSGKTTTAHRLCTQLRVVGRKPLLISTDDYFVGDERNPRDAEGKLDYEHVDAVDSERLAADINALFAGKAVKLRKFDFIVHEGHDAEVETRLSAGGVVVIEGIHALNPRLTRGIDDALKFRVYLNAMTQLVLDSCNRISATDTRLLRRIVRDFNYRGRSPIDTIRMWPGVIAGGRRWIYPFQNSADAVFNSSLDYELAVLKSYVSPLLAQVKPWHAEYSEAIRLIVLLQNFSPATADAVPGDSILRETIGGSQLDY